MFSKKTSAFTYCGEYFANCEVSGIITIWETSSNTIKKEYDINSHLNQKCSILTWGSFKNIDIGNISENKETQLLIIGTTIGNIYVYDFLNDKLFTHFESGHIDTVNDFCVDMEKKCLFSCSSDKSVIIWDIISGKIKQKWKAGSEELYSLCTVDHKSVLIGSTSISWWNINKQEIIKTFCCGDAPITILTLIKSADVSSGLYFLSAASGIPKITAWCLNEENSRKAVATFTLPDELQNVDVTDSFSKNDPMVLSAVTKSGSLLLFQHVLNGKTKNLSPVMTVHIASKETSESQPYSIPIISSKLLYCAEACIITYGCDSNLVFESVNIFDCPKTLTLTRELPSQQNIIKNIPKVKLCKRLKDFSVVNGRASPVDSPHCSPGKKKRQEIQTQISHIPQKEIADDTSNKISFTDKRISSKSPNVKIKHKSSKIKEEKPSSSESDSELITFTDPSEMIDIIVRGVQEDNISLVNSVLKCDNLELIKAAVRNLPLHSLNVILIELHRRLIMQENRYNSCYRRWIKEILVTHLPYLITCKDLSETINKLKDFVDTKNIGATLIKMNMIRGLLKVQMQAIAQHKSEDSSSESETEELMES